MRINANTYFSFISQGYFKILCMQCYLKPDKEKAGRVFCIPNMTNHEATQDTRGCWDLKVVNNTQPFSYMFMFISQSVNKCSKHMCLLSAVGQTSTAEPRGQDSQLKISTFSTKSSNDFHWRTNVSGQSITVTVVILAPYV